MKKKIFFRSKIKGMSSKKKSGMDRINEKLKEMVISENDSDEDKCILSGRKPKNLEELNNTSVKKK